ncbi:hypothetical protein SUGI_0995050 [Cryptomeria japonica]|nr:hypothetical protein SUGI_0995050 [Cryptomeria japonica]
MATKTLHNSVLNETTCGSLLHDLQLIWDEVGENDTERDKMLLQLEQECLEVYRRKVDKANLSRAQLHQQLADSEAELAHLLSVLGERSFVGRPEKQSGTLKEQIAAIAPALEDLRQKKEERIKKFMDVQVQIRQICDQIAGNSKPHDIYESLRLDDHDLSLKKLDEFHLQLQELHREKNDRLQKVLDYVNIVHDLSAVVGIEFSKIISEVHPSLDDSTGIESMSISDGTLGKLANTVESLKNEKQRRLQKIQELGAELMELWNLMDIPKEEQKHFNHVTCYISASVEEVSVPRALALDIIEEAEVEVKRLDQLKASKLKELLVKKQTELEDIYRRAHMEIDIKSAQENIMAMIDSGTIDHLDLLASMDDQIAKAKEEAQSRKEIMEKVEKWMAACEEENWLEDYNRDENRYSVSRGAHINLKRAERARVMVNKIPALVDSLMAKTRGWEEERGTTFLYDEVPLLAMLDEYNMLRQEREEEKRRFRDKKRLQGQLTIEQETFFGARASPHKQLSSKKAMGLRLNGNSVNGNSVNGPPFNRRLSLGVQHTRMNGLTPARQGLPVNGKREHTRPMVPLNYTYVSHEDSASQFSAHGSTPSSP